MADLMRLCLAILMLLCAADEPFVSSYSVKRPGFPQTIPVTVQMPGYTPTKNDDYVCTAIKVSPGYILRYEPISTADRVHHILMYGCKEPFSKTDVWKGTATCKGRSKIIYAWARNAPKLDLPPEVGLSIGHPEDDIDYIVLQVHYATTFNGTVRDYSGVRLDVTNQRPRYFSAVYLFVSGTTIPPNQEAFYVNMSCQYKGNLTLYPFAFRTHTHKMGRVVSAFVVHNGSWNMIGKRNPQWPQMFQSVNHSVRILPGDYLAAQCRFDSSNVDNYVSMGSRGSDEMCNFYMMYYRDSAGTDPFHGGGFCSGPQLPYLFKQYPTSGQSLLPSRPDLESHAKQSAVSFGMLMASRRERRGGGGAFHSRRRPPLQQPAHWHCHVCVVDKMRFTEVGGVKLGQIGGLAVDPSSGNLLIFHRASRVWGAHTFNASYRLRDETTIDDYVVLVVDASSSPPKLLSKWARNRFYLPHGVAVDRQGAVYFTDVGSHQVFKFSGGDKWREEWTLGERLVPGADNGHFCQPAAVAVALDGTVFVADGYCNNRVVKISSNGRYLTEWGHRSSGEKWPGLGTFVLPHDIVVDNDKSLVRVADRENGRVQTFQMDGVAVSEIRPPARVRTVYSLDIFGNDVYFIPGEAATRSNGGTEPIEGFAADGETNLLQFSWTPKSAAFTRPHVLRLGLNGNTIFVGEIGNPGLVWQFEVVKDRSTARSKTTESVAKTSSSHRHHHFWTLLLTAVSVSILLSFLICICVRYCKYSGIGRLAERSSNFRQKPFLDKQGFKPLNTEDIDAMDDLTTDESDLEDTLYSLRPKGPMLDT